MKKFILIGLFISFLTAAFSQNNFKVNAASYLATNNVDEVNGVDVAPDGTIVVAGKLVNYSNSNALVYNLLGGGDATVVRFNTKGDVILSITHIGDIGSTINDIQVCDNGRIAITGSFGVGVLKPDGSDFVWHDSSIQKGTVTAHTNSFYAWFSLSQNTQRYKRAMSRVAIGSDGVTATIQQVANYGSSYLYVYDDKGTLMYDSIFPATTTMVFPDRTFTGDYNINVYPNDICVDAKNKSIIIGGWNPRKDNSVYMTDHPIHMPYIKCFDYAGNLKWLDYDWRAKAVYDMGSYADSRINDINIGRDGYLYTAGYIHGGDHMFVIGPKQIVKNDALAVGFDSYSSAYGMGAGIDQAYFCQYDPVNGNMIRGMAAMVRKQPDGNGQPNQSQIKGIMADENGKVYLAGYCQPYIKNRALQTINGIPVGTRDTCEAFVMVVNPDWKSREIWTVMTKNKLEGAFWGLGYRNGIAAAAGEVFNGEAITTSNAIQNTRMSGYDGYMVTWGNLTTGIAGSLKKDEIRVYQRMLDNKLIISGNDISKIEISDASGKKIRSINCKLESETHILTADFTHGIYFVVVQQKSGEKTTHKIIKN